MKLIHCDLCDDVIKIKFNLRHCKCKNIGGKYLKEDGRTAEIYLKNTESFKTSRVLGFPNSVRYGKEREGTCWVFNWNDPFLVVYCDGVRQVFYR